MVNALKDFSGYAGAGLAEKIVGFMISAYCIRELSKVSYAELGLFLSMLSFINIVVDFGNNGWLRTIYIKRCFDFKNSLVIAMKTSLLVMLLCFFLSSYFFHSYFSFGFFETAVFFFVLLFMYFDSLLSGLFVTFQNSKSYFLYKVPVSFFHLLIFFFIVWLGFLGDLLDVRLLALAVSLSIGLLVFWGGVMRGICLTNKPQCSHRNRLAFTAPLMLNGLAVNGILIFDKWVLGIFGEKELLAEVFVVFSLIMPISFIGDIIGKQYMTKFMGYMRDRDFKQLFAVQVNILVLVFSLCCFVSVVGKAVLVLYAGDKYDTKDVQYLVGFLAFYPFFKVVYQLQARKFLFYEKTKHLMWISCTSGVLYLLLLYINADNLSSIGYVLIFQGYSVAVALITSIYSFCFFAEK